MLKRIALSILLSLTFISYLHAQPTNTNVSTIPSYAKLVNGTATSPAIYFGSDTDTGIYLIGANNLGIATGGVKRVDINSTRTAITGAITAASGTLTGSSTPHSFSQTWNNASTTFNGLNIDITNTASNAASNALAITNGSGGNLLRVGIAGNIISVSNGSFDSLTTSGASTGLTVAAAGFVHWSSSSYINAPADGLYKFGSNGFTAGFVLDSTAAADTVRVKNFANNAEGNITAASFQNSNTTNGQKISDLQTLTELTTIAASATTDTTIQMPANSVVLAVAVRVTVAIPTATTFTVGDSGSAARFSTAAVSVNLNSTDPGTKAGAYYNASALSIRITPSMTPANNNGRVRVVIYYYTVTPPTS